MKNLFCFSDLRLLSIPNDSFLINISENINDKNSLFREYAEKLEFPSYFGMNWNAMIDCLCDLSNIDKRDIFIVHSDLPFAFSYKDRSDYLDMLIAVVETWYNWSEHKLYVYFPFDLKVEIDKTIASL